MNTEEKQERINNSLIYVLGVEKEDISVESYLITDLGADSLDIVELIMRLEVEFNIAITDYDVDECHQVGDLYRIIEKKLTPN